MASETPNNKGLYIPSTYIWDVQNLTENELKQADLKELLIRLYQNINSITLALNLKDSAYYDTSEFVNGQMFFPNPSASGQLSFRNVYRMTLNFGALPNTTTKSVNHTIPVIAGYTFTRIYGAASDTTNKAYIPIPYASPTAANNIELSVSATQVTITTGSNRSSFDTCYVVLEYIKS